MRDFVVVVVFFNHVLGRVGLKVAGTRFVESDVVLNACVMPNIHIFASGIPVL